MNELQILSPDGKTRTIPLDRDSFSLGRSRGTELSFPDDTGLSRQHLTIERCGDNWIVRDLGSRNGTVLNGVPISGEAVLKPGDKISAGHLIIICGEANGHEPVVVFDPAEGTGSHKAMSDSATVFTALEDAMKRDVSGSDSGDSGPRALAVNHMSALIRAGNELAGHRPLPELFKFILDLSIQAVRAHRGVLLTLEDGELVVRANKGEGFHISTAVRDRVLNSGVSVLVRDTSADDALRERRSIVEQNIQTLMAVPLQTQDQIIGIIYVDSPSLIREFTRDDLNLLTVMANVAAVRIEQARYAEAEQARRLMARDLEQAAEIQKGILPAQAPRVPGLDVAGHNAPCRTVGGDYFDFYRRGPDKLAMFLGDVSGKGMPASLLMMGLQARVQVLIEDAAESLGEMMTKLNRITSAHCPANRFISLFFCILDGATGEVTFCNAGHNPPVLVRANGEHELVKGGGPVIGLLPSIDYKEHRLQLEPGDLLVIYSDGVTEAVNAANEQFGVARLADIVAAQREKSAGEIVSTVNSAVETFTGGAPQSDDITLIVARRVAR
ncbi:MAG TPA: SpoIIE family protein phosphatase [Bryobacteraceae bacterium]|nr:SpoIIE family protein phosphatase [Bryobacteraceae bacterium]